MQRIGFKTKDRRRKYEKNCQGNVFQLPYEIKETIERCERCLMIGDEDAFMSLVQVSL